MVKYKMKPEFALIMPQKLLLNLGRKRPGPWFGVPGGLGQQAGHMALQGRRVGFGQRPMEPLAASGLHLGLPGEV